MVDFLFRLWLAQLLSLPDPCFFKINAGDGGNVEGLSRAFIDTTPASYCNDSSLFPVRLTAGLVRTWIVGSYEPELMWCRVHTRATSPWMLPSPS